MALSSEKNSTNRAKAKIRLSQFDKDLAAAVNESTLDAVNFHHAAGRSVFGLNKQRELVESFPPTSEIIQQQ